MRSLISNIWVIPYAKLYFASVETFTDIYHSIDTFVNEVILMTTDRSIDGRESRLAEAHPLCAVRTDKYPSAGSPVNSLQSGFYQEFQIVSSLEEPLFAINSAGEEVIIHNSVMYSSEKKVTIYARSFNGQRTFSHLNETSKSHHVNIVIPQMVLHEGPIYVRTCDLILFTGSYRDHVHHPNDPVFRKKKMQEMFATISAQATYAPITITANDPSGKLKSLWVSIGNLICPVDCTHYSDDPDEDYIHIGWRDIYFADGIKPRVHEIRLRDLNKAPQQIMTSGPITISTKREFLKHHIEHVTGRSVEETISITDHQRIMTEVCKENHQVIGDLRNRTKVLQDQVTTLRSTQDTMAQMAINAEEIRLRADELELERDKLVFLKQELIEKQKRLEAELVLREKELKAKDRERRASTVSTVAKTVGVVVPTCLALWKAYETFQKGRKES